MLKAFHAGVQRGDPDVRVVAGATAPIGLNDRYRTSPQRFARFLKANGAAAYFDVYSHHPYTPGGTAQSAPDGMPNDPSTTVTLRNLPTLLRLFPSKPFYLTEYAYNTRSTIQFGLTVTPVEQAIYLRRAYAYVQRFRQVKMLVWYLVRDTPPPPGSGAGVRPLHRPARGERRAQAQLVRLRRRQPHHGRGPLPRAARAGGARQRHAHEQLDRGGGGAPADPAVPAPLEPLVAHAAECHHQRPGPLHLLAQADEQLRLPRRLARRQDQPQRHRQGPLSEGPRRSYSGGTPAHSRRWRLASTRSRPGGRAA